MDMSLWSHHYKLYQHEGTKYRTTNDNGTYYNWVASTNLSIPYLTTYFDFSIKNYSINGSNYGAVILPRYGINMNSLLHEFMVSGSSGVPDYRNRILQSNGLDAYYIIDYVNIGGCHIYGARNYNNDDYTTGHSSIIVYANATGFDGTNTGQKIIVTYSPNDKFNNNNGIHGMILSTKSNTKHYYTNLSSAGVRGGTERGELYVKWLNPNYGKTEQYILNPLAVDGLYTDKVFTIDGGLEPLPYLTKMDLGGTNYLILNEHIAIKYT